MQKPGLSTAARHACSQDFTSIRCAGGRSKKEVDKESGEHTAGEV